MTKIKVHMKLVKTIFTWTCCLVGRAYLADQLLRAGTSVPLNIAEGAGEYSSSEKIRFYRMARRSAY